MKARLKKFTKFINLQQIAYMQWRECAVTVYEIIVSVQ